MKSAKSPKSNPAEQKISVQIEGGGGQTTTYRETLAIDGRKLRITIHTDSHPGQCNVHVDLWTGEKWSEVHRIFPAAMKTPHGLGYSRAGDRKPTAADYAEDRKELIRVALAVLGPAGLPAAAAA